MIKPIWWQLPLVLTGSAALGAGIFCGAFYMQKANPHRDLGSTPYTADDAGIMQAYYTSIEQGSRLLVLPGYTHTNPLTRFLNVDPKTNPRKFVAASSTGYILLDDPYGLPKLTTDGKHLLSNNQPLFSSNVASAMFRTDLGSFITGVAIGEFLNEKKDLIIGNSGRTEFRWATYGGSTYSNVTGYMGGLQRGLHWFNENIANVEKGILPVRQIFINDTQAGNFASGFGMTDGNELINMFLAEKVDVLVPVAGPQTQQAINMINARQAKTFVIGVDSEAELDTNVNKKLAALPSENIIPFSSIKGLDTVGAKIMENINAGINYPENDNETIGGFGYISVGTLDNGGVGVSKAGYEYFIKAMQRYNNLVPGAIALDPEKITESYNAAVQALLTDESFINLDLNNPENKVYYWYDNWWELPHNPKASCSYADLPNGGYKMMPIKESEFNKWIEEEHNGVSYKAVESELRGWLRNNQQAIEYRKNFTLKDKLVAENYDNYNGYIKVVVNSPTSPLLDKSFAQTSLMAIILYWEKQGIIIKKP